MAIGDIINPDFMPDAENDPKELWAAWHAIHIAPRSCARIIFPDRPRGYVRATKDLGNYLANKATAVQQRLEGNTQTALSYEDICQRIYDRLPAFARW